LRAGGGDAGTMVNQIYRLDFSRIDSPRIHYFHRYWKDKRPSPDAIPLRADFDPADLRELLPNIVVIEVEQEPMRFRYRLVGTRVVEFNGLDFSGLYLGTIGWQEEHQLVDACTDAVVAKAPLCGFYTWTLKSGSTGKCEFAIFPFSNDGRTVTQIFGIEDYDFPRDYSGARSRVTT
jgi:hypothetical protein